MTHEQDRIAALEEYEREQAALRDRKIIVHTIDSLAWELVHYILSYHADVLALISNACSLCRDRPDMRGDAATVIEKCLSTQVGDYEPCMLCTECGKEFQPAPWEQLRRSARRYVDAVQEDARLFYTCKACGGQLPFDV